MYNTPTITTLSLAVLLGIIGVVQLAGPRFLSAWYLRWHYSQRLRYVTGLLDIAAAAMLAAPNARGWGIALAAILIFGSAVTLLNHRQYVYAAAVTVMMAALVPATLAVPRTNQVHFITPETQLVAIER